MKRLKGCLAFLLGLFILGLLARLLKATWPVCAPAAAVAIAWFSTRNSKHAVKSAIHDVLGPIMAGLLLVCSLLLLFSATDPSPDAVNYAERALVHVDSRAPEVAKLSLLRFSVVMVLLTSIAYFFPKTQSVTRFALVKKWIGRTTATLGAATTFTFFTNVAVVQPKVPDVYNKIEVLYRRSKESQAKAVDRYLAAKAVKRGLSNLQTPERSFLEYLLEGVSAVPAMNGAQKKVLASYTASQLHYDIGLPIGAEDTHIVVADLPHRDALKMLDDQLTTEKTASRFADQAVKAAEESLAFGNDALKDLGWSFVEGLIGEQGAEISRLAKPFVDQILDKYFEKYTEPIVEQQAETVRHFFLHSETEEAAKVLARSKTRSAMALMSFSEARSAQDTARQAMDSAQNAKTDFRAGNDDKAQMELTDAEHATTNSQKHAELAKAAANSLKDGEQTLLTGSNQVRVDVALGEAAEAARSLRAAAQAEEAIKMARTTAQVLEDARAAKNAAETAEAMKTVLRAIPK
jgi:hypothetical protein